MQLLQMQEMLILISSKLNKNGDISLSRAIKLALEFGPIECNTLRSHYIFSISILLNSIELLLLNSFYEFKFFFDSFSLTTLLIARYYNRRSI